MTIPRDLAPDHLFNIPELDFSGDIFVDPLKDTWFRLGVWATGRHRDSRGVEEVIERQSLLIPADGLSVIYDRLDAIGNVLNGLGQPTASVFHDAEGKSYSYSAFHEFQLCYGVLVGEPLVFFHSDGSGSGLLVNPDLWLYLGLEERPAHSRIWSDPRRAREVLRRVTLPPGIVVVEIRTAYLLKYLQARQKALLVGHYRHLHLFYSTPTQQALFVTGDLTIGSTDLGAKALFNNWGLRSDGLARDPFMQRRLHLWFAINPPAINIENPWSEEPTFDIYAFTFPTREGPVAPARFRQSAIDDKRQFAGVHCDFMNRIYFRQEVLMKYETTSGFTVSDDGSVHCEHYWSLSRSTARLGNELVCTGIGDFAEGVPFEEWPHWKQYSVEPPTDAMVDSIHIEQPIADAVNHVVHKLEMLNGALAAVSSCLRADGSSLWQGSLDSLAGRQLKWVYPDTAANDEFMKRATLLSTLVVDELKSAPLRRLLMAIDPTLHQNDDRPSRPLASRRLLERATLAAALIEQFHPDLSTLADLILQAEGRKVAADADLQNELSDIHRHIREEFAPLAFLYDLRTHGGLAHPPNLDRAREAAESLGLPSTHWRRADYLRLLELTASGIERAAAHLRRAALAV